MESLKIITLAKIQLSEMVEIWNRCWQGYYYDMTYSYEQMKFWLGLGKVDLANSIALYSHDHVVGFSLLAVDNFEGWIAGTCIEPQYRGRGLFEPLMESQIKRAESIGLKRLYLEVMVQNPAQKVYGSVGFKKLRQLHIYRTASGITVPSKPSTIMPFKQLLMSEYFENRRQASINPAWQRRQNYLERYGNAKAFINSSGTAGILIVRQKNAPILDVWSSNNTGAEEIISTILTTLKKGFSLLNQPEDYIVAYLHQNGIPSHAQQYEMCMELA
ncbi:acetyltransferase [Desulfosporosinus acidiphilus SJ4]|uniref:Acetyltransferase n=1 Tax=Desulfosporosinus acidiphilus (strain DSM 22704 / JCM 16185 / SJ4) TaxID=646529 RepID=I4D7Y1_DESAJ|nr:GNAT family N-acetyltransferase [Desulfosporosinus acidiphilus]AFM41905.1 acetyltransferase [Desulfosporosinus acidiphilus SJ4]